MSTPEDLYREKFSGYTPQPPDGMWNGINSRMRRRSFLKFSPRTFNIYYAAAACALALAGYSQLNNTPSDIISIPAPYASTRQIPDPAERGYASASQLTSTDIPGPGINNGSQLTSTNLQPDSPSPDTAIPSHDTACQIHEAPAATETADAAQPAQQIPAAPAATAEPRHEAKAPAATTEIAWAAKGLQAAMEARTQGASLSYSWNMGDGTRAVGRRVQHRYSKPGTYKVRLYAFSANARIHDTIYQEITIKGNEYQLKFPNALVASTSEAPFAPRGNVAEVSKYRLAVYSRNGAEVFATTNPYEGWNGYYKGERLPKGVYAYRASYEFVNGEQATSNGSITLFWEENTNLTIHR